MSSNAVRITRPERVPKNNPEIEKLTSSRAKRPLSKVTSQQTTQRGEGSRQQLVNNNNNNIKTKYDPYGTDVYNFKGGERHIHTGNVAASARTNQLKRQTEVDTDLPPRFHDHVNTDRILARSQLRSKPGTIRQQANVTSSNVTTSGSGRGLRQPLQKTCLNRGQGGSSSKNNPNAGAPPQGPLKNASSVSSLDSKHQKSGLLKFSGSKERGLDTRTLGNKDKGTKSGKFLGSRDKGLDKLGSRDKGLDHLVPSSSREKNLENLGSNSTRGLDKPLPHNADVKGSRDRGLQRLGQGDGADIGAPSRRQDNFEVPDDGRVDRQHFARGDFKVTGARESDSYQLAAVTNRQRQDLDRGISGANNEQELTREFQSLPYDFATSVMIQQKQSHAEQTNAMLQQEIEALHRQLDTAAQTRVMLETRLDEQRSIHGAEIKALEHALDSLREQNSGLEERLEQTEKLIENERREHAKNQLLEKQKETAEMEQELKRVKDQITELEQDRMALEQDREALKQERSVWEQERRDRIAERMNDGGDSGEMVELLQVPETTGAGNRRLHSSAPASIAVSNSQDDNTLATACPTPEWEKNTSCKSLDHMSIACLQVKIHEMEETHHSTNEELQATLQELSDLQSQLSEMQSHNERLKEEKNSLYQSLLQQNEEKQNSTQFKDDVYDAEMKELKESFAQINADNLRMKERLLVLEGTLDGSMADKKDLEEMLLRSRDESSEKDIEINRLSMLLENAKTKIVELENDRDRDDNKTDLGELLAAARKEKDDLRTMLADLQEQLSKSHCEVARLKDQVLTLQEDCMVMRNNAKCAMSDLQYKYEQLMQEKRGVTAELQMQQEAYTGFQEQNAQLAQECRLLQSGIEQARLELHDTQQQLQQEQRSRQEEHAEWEQFQTDLLMTVRVANNFKVEAQEQIEQLKVENEGLKNYILDLECKVDQMKDVTNESNEDNHRSPTALALSETETKDTLIRLHVTKSNITNAADVIQKPPYIRQDSRVSVKCLIEDIEKQASQKLPTKQLSSVDKTNSANSSTGSLNSLSNTGSIQPTNDIISSLNSPTNNRDTNWADAMFEQNTQPAQGYVKNPLREQPQQNKYQYLSKTSSVTPKTSTKLYNTHPDVVAGGPTYAYLKSNYKSTHSKPTDEQKITDYSRRTSNHGDQVAEHRDPLNALYANGGSKRNALLKWCQERTSGYRNIDITNFSSSWNDGMALCALLHTYVPERIPYATLVPSEKRRNFSLAFAAAESVGIPTSLNINDMIQLERPDWHQVMAYVIAIYKHFEV